MRSDETGVDARQTDGFDPEFAAYRENAGVDKAIQDHRRYVDGLLIGDAAAVDHLGLDAECSLHAVELRTAAVHEHGLDADLVQDRDLFDERPHGDFIAEDRAARFDDEYLVLVHADVGRGAHERQNSYRRVGATHHRNSPNQEPSGQHAGQNGHLPRQTIEGLALDDGAGSIEYFIGDGDIAAHRQAMHELGVGQRRCEPTFSDAPVG